MKKIGITSCFVSARTVTIWYREFRVKRKFPVIKYGKNKLPPFLSDNNDMKEKIMQFCRENLDELTAKLVLEFIHDKLLPILVHFYHFW